jgi:hypothetical protein
MFVIFIPGFAFLSESELSSIKSGLLNGVVLGQYESRTMDIFYS